MVVQEIVKERMGKAMAMESDHGVVMEEEDHHVLVRSAEEEDVDDDLVLPGYRFHPTDEELVTFYLRRKVAGKRLSVEIIKEMDIYKHEPWDFTKTNTVGGDKEWYFFCLRGRKYRNSVRPNRVTGAGFWKATGIDRPIRSAGGGCIGLKKSLVYYRGSAGKGTKTDWMMHEFRLPPRPDAAVHASPSLQEAEVWTICRLFKRSITYNYKKKPQEQTAAAAAAPAPAPQPDSTSSVTANSLESDCTGEEYMNCSLPAPTNYNSVYSAGAGNEQSFQEQYWNSCAPPQPQPQPDQLPLFHPMIDDVLSPVAAAPPSMVDGCWDDIGRMVMELTADPALFYDCRYSSCELGEFNSVLG